MLERIKGKRNLSDLVFLLKISGLWFDFKGKGTEVFQKLRYFYLLTVFIFMNVSSFRDGIKKAFTGPFFSVSGGYYVLLQVIIYYVYRGKTSDILKKFKRINKKRTENWQWEIFDKQSNIVWTIVWFYGIMAISYIVFYYAAPFLYDICLVIFSTEVDDKIFSFPYALEEVRKNDRDFVHYTMQLMSLCWSLMLVGYGMGSLGLQTIVCSYCCIEMRILRKTIENGGKQKLLNEKKFLKKIVRKHTDVLSIISDAKIVIGPAVAAQIALGAILLAAFLFAMMETDGDVALIVTYILLFTTIASLNFAFCLFGEMLQIQGDKLYECLCCLPWNEMTPKTRKDFNIILVQAGMPIQINYKGLLPVNFQSFQFTISVYTPFSVTWFFGLRRLKNISKSRNEKSRLKISMLAIFSITIFFIYM